MNHTQNQIEIYQTADGQSQVDIRIEQDTFWLSQKKMAVLFDKDSDTIGLHLKNIFKEGELGERAITEESSVVRQEGKRQVNRKIKFYNLDAIISVGYRVNSKKGTQFRIWATARLKALLLQGYSLHQQRFEQNANALQQALTRLKQSLIERREASELFAKPRAAFLFVNFFTA